MSELYVNEELDNYNYNVEVSYKNIKIDDDDSEKENNLKQDVYQQQFLKCLRLEGYNDLLVMSMVDEIYNLVKQDNKIQNYCEKLKNKILMLSLMHNVKDKAPTEFIFLFAYDYFEVMHCCLKDFFTLGYISDINNEKMLELLNE